jgi:metallo-beta-lactamase family protein
MIISPSGMCEAGRIQHHLANNIADPKNTILITGYSAEHTLGRRIVEKEPTVRIYGEEYPLKAEVAVMNSLSAHADRDELLGYVGRFDRSRLQNILLVHGDFDQQQKFSDGLTKELGFSNVRIPQSGDKIEIP